MKKFLAYTIPILLCFAVGMLGSYIQGSAIEEWYPTLIKSPLTPPPIIFPIAWSIIYLLMGISIGTLIVRGDMSVVRLWLMQLLVNFLWSVLFFALRSPLAGLVAILILDVFVLTYIIYAYGKHKIAAILFIPYMIWLLFATYLNGYIYLHNTSQQSLYAATTPKTTYIMTETPFYSMPALPYPADALEPTMSKQTIDYHYGKHLKGYVDNLNRLISGSPYQGMSLEAVVMRSDGAIFNNAAQIWNHALYFDSMTPKKSSIPPHLQSIIERDFGSIEQFQKEFTATATTLFGSGWVWLVEDSNGKLSILSTSNADNAMRHGLNPLLVLDVWEHAYYIDYRNRRADFIKDWWSLVDWQKAANRLKHQ